jgi:hypothetical protein
MSSDKAASQSRLGLAVVKVEVEDWPWGVGMSYLARCPMGVTAGWFRKLGTVCSKGERVAAGIVVLVSFMVRSSPMGTRRPSSLGLVRLKGPCGRVPASIGGSRGGE